MEWVTPRWEADSEVPDYIGELALYELVDRVSRNHPSPVGAASESPIDIARPILCNGTLRVLHFRWSVAALEGDLRLWFVLVASSVFPSRPKRLLL